MGGRNASSNSVNNTETWNGTNWTEVNDLNTSRGYTAGFGTSTAAICAAGFTTNPGGAQDVTESWNGTNWTEVNDTNTARYSMVGFGSPYTAGIIAGGSTPPRTANTES